MHLPISGAIDCDIHPALPGPHALLPYLDEYWRDTLTMIMRGLGKFEMNSYPLNAPLTARPDWRVKDGVAGSSLAQMQTQALDHFGLKAAIGNCLNASMLVFNPDLGAALCRAINDWLVQEWLDKDPRLRASIVISMTDADAAAEEIERRASDKRFVQVLTLVMGELPLGRRQHWPIYRAAEKHKLPIGVHAGSMFRHAPTQSGYPSYLAEDYTTQAQAFATQTISFVAEGVFQRFPELRVVLIESGVSWLPGLMWRVSKDWRGVRTEVPWIKKIPAEIIRDHFRLTIQPLDGPPDRADLGRLIDHVGSEDILLFATDYPHWQFDGDDVLPDGLPETMLRKILVDNPLAAYPRLKETL